MTRNTQYLTFNYTITTKYWPYWSLLILPLQTWIFDKRSVENIKNISFFPRIIVRRQQKFLNLMLYSLQKRCFSAKTAIYKGFTGLCTWQNRIFLRHMQWHICRNIYRYNVNTDLVIKKWNNCRWLTNLSTTKYGIFNDMRVNILHVIAINYFIIHITIWSMRA